MTRTNAHERDSQPVIARELCDATERRHLCGCVQTARGILHGYYTGDRRKTARVGREQWAFELTSTAFIAHVAIVAGVIATPERPGMLYSITGSPTAAMAAMCAIRPA